MIALLHRLATAARRLRRNINGNVLMIFGFSLLPLTMATGMTIDYARAARLQTRLNMVTDAAALSGVTPQMLAQTRQYSVNMVYNTFYAQAGVGQCQGTYNRIIFATGCTYQGGDDGTSTYTFTDGTLSIVVQDITNANGGISRTIKLKYVAASGNIFGNLLGMTSIPIGGTSNTQGSPITYLDYYILLDISQSMGIGATAADMQNLFNRSKTYNNDGCVFGCHVALAGEPYSNIYLAHNMSPTITLRIDSAVAAIQNIIADAQAAAGTTGNIRIGLYTMSQDPTTGNQLNVITSPTSNYSNLSTLAAGITLGGNYASGTGDTNYSSQLSQFNALVPANGNGNSASSPLNYVFVIGDGVADTPGACTSGHCTAAFDPTLCATLKVKSTVGTIYTTYLPIYNNNDSTQGYNVNYQQLVLPFASQIAPNMQSCATNSSYYYQATDGPALNTAMRALFASTLKTARITL